MITKIQYIHNGRPLDLYNTGSSDPVILPNAIKEIRFFQDIEVPSVEGEILCSDVALYDLMPMTDGDKIRIYLVNVKYNLGGTHQIDKDFYVEFRIVSSTMTSSEPDVTEKDNYKEFVINIIDDSSFDSYLTRNSRRYSNHTASEIVTDVLKPYWKKIDVGNTPGRYDLTLPKWSAYHQIRYLSKFAEFSDGSGCATFPTLPVYFANGGNDYKFRFVSFGQLFATPESFIQEEYSLTSEINRVVNVFLEKDANFFDLLNTGAIIGADSLDTLPGRRVMKRRTYDSLPTKYRQTRVDSPWGVNYSKNYLTKNLLNQIRLWATVGGDVKRQIGTTIDFKFPSGFSAFNKKDFFDEQHSGKYLIRTIEHIFIKDQDNKWIFSQKLGLVTDGYGDKK